MSKISSRSDVAYFTDGLSRQTNPLIHIVTVWLKQQLNKITLAVPNISTAKTGTIYDLLWPGIPKRDVKCDDCFKMCVVCCVCVGGEHWCFFPLSFLHGVCRVGL